jgi:alpha-tubulin suppressor-like RCC1 family protein
VVGVSAGVDHSCALLAVGVARCWGDNTAGGIGDGTTNLAPTAVDVQLTGIVQISAGFRFTCALLADGTVRCWGDNSNGAIGDGTNLDRHLPVQVVGLSNVVSLASTAYQTMCAVIADGTIRCWGSNSGGQIGDGTQDPRPVPVTVPSVPNATDVASEQDHTCASLANGQAFCWGTNTSGELGAVDAADHFTATRVIDHFASVQSNGSTVMIPIPLQFVVSIHTGLNHTCSRSATGAVECWGANKLGQVGIGTITNSQPRPTLVPSFTANVVPAVTLRANERIATVVALVNCDEGERAHLEVTLSQGEAIGTGTSDVGCTGGLAAFPMIVPAQTPVGFSLGAATAHVHAVIRDGGTIVENLNWTRAVTLSSAP